MPSRGVKNKRMLGGHFLTHNDTYDNNGNVLTTTDAKGTTITNAYDALNRPLTRTYSDGTPTVTNSYDDSNVPFSKGKLTKVTSSISETTYTSFDVAGRLLASTQRTPLDGETIANATPRTSSYQYNLSGALTQQTYPSGRVVNHQYDASGDIARIYGKPTSTATEQTYATGFQYFADGKIERLKLGNGLWESAKLNSRLQATEITMGYSVGDGSHLKLNYEYGELQTNGTVDATENAGNIAKQTVNFSGLANPFVQTFKYDSLDRITEAIEKVNGVQTWKQTFGYDIYGNRNAFYEKVGEQELAMNNLTLPTVDTNTNRFNAGQGYGYDKNGNITTDPANGGRTFVFNGDNKQTEVRDANNAVVGRYLYDGNGKRVKKVTNVETTVFVYDGMGKLVAEYSTATPPANPTINYTATDQLGSPRVLTDKLGNVVSRRDFLPFGEEIYANSTANRTEANKYSLTGQDSVRKRFTGYEKDAETGLDFAEARYYQNQHGRFTAVDPLLASGKSANPQTFNRYTYTMNRPLILVDPTGLQSGRKPEENKKEEVIKIYTTNPRIVSVKTEYLDKTKWNDVPVDGGRFQITYTFIVNAGPEGTKPEDAANIEPAPARDSKGNIDESKSPRGTLSDTQNLERTEVKSEVTPNGKEEGFKVTKTETFRVNRDKERSRPEFNGTINYQVVLRDPATGYVRRVVTTDKKHSDLAISISNAPRKEEKKKNEEE
ncbi:MAG: RHS repeat protein [Acidobacteria bacterium]|nr:RHS repeat protein [Acidobacteriota bacterium]